MGLFDFTLGTQKNLVGTTGIFNGHQEEPDSPGEAARKANAEELKQQREALQSRANSFRQGLPQYKEALGAQAQDQGTRELQGQTSGINRNMNQRGLLYSGLNQGAQAGAGSAYASALAKRRSQINEQSDSIADQMDQRSIDAGFQEQQLRAAAAKAAYEQQVQNKQNEDKSRGSLFGALGSLGGSLFGKND